jgi:hypothetical protein
MPALSRLLYDSGHAAASLALSFATATSVQEPLFWCDELLRSGMEPDLFLALWTGFYATRAITNPHIAEYITIKVMEWAGDRGIGGPGIGEEGIGDSSATPIRHIVSKLYMCARDTTVLDHYAYHTSSSDSSATLRGKGPTWLAEEYHPSTHLVIRHLHRKSPAIALSLIAQEPCHIVLQHMVHACATYLGAPEAERYDRIEEVGVVGPNTQPSFAHTTITRLQAFVIILRKRPHPVPHSSGPGPGPGPGPVIDTQYPIHPPSLVGPDANHIDILIPDAFIRPFISTTSNTNNTSPPSALLRRQFATHPGSLIFAQVDAPTLDRVGMDWLDLVVGCPLWDARIAAHGGTIVDGHVHLDEETDDFDRFHNAYGIDFDEQSSRLQQMSAPRPLPLLSGKPDPIPIPLTMDGLSLG